MTCSMLRKKQIIVDTLNGVKIVLTKKPAAADRKATVTVDRIKFLKLFFWYDDLVSGRITFKITNLVQFCWVLAKQLVWRWLKLAKFS